jgi:hypothetical protein
MSESRLGKDIFVALAAVAWADGKLDPDEADGIVRAAVDEGLSLEEIGEIEAATKEKVDLGVIDKSGLSKEDRLFVYAVACWIARMDGQVTQRRGHRPQGGRDARGRPPRAVRPRRRPPHHRGEAARSPGREGRHLS